MSRICDIGNVTQTAKSVPVFPERTATIPAMKNWHRQVHSTTQSIISED